MLTQRRPLLAAVSVIAVLGSASARALSTGEFLASPRGEDDPSVRILMEEVDGNIVVSLFADDCITDLRDITLDVDDPSKLQGLTVIGDDVSAFAVRLDRDLDDHGDHDGDDHREWDSKHDGRHDHKDHKDKDHKNHSRGKHHGDDDFKDGKHSTFENDIAIVLGTRGDDILETSLVLDARDPLAIADFSGERIWLSVKGLRGGDCGDGKCDDEREVELKLVAVIPQPIPEPSTALLFLLGLGSLGYAGRRH